MAKLNSIEYLIDREFYAKPKPDIDGVEGLERAIDEFRAYLVGLSKERLAELVKEEQQRELSDPNPFITPMHWPDYCHWSRMPFWYLDEAIALSLGRAPERVSWETMEPMVSHRVLSLPNQYQSRREFVLRAKEWGQITDPIQPAAFLAWADSVKMTVPDDLRNCLAEPASADDADERVRRLQAQVKELEEQVRFSSGRQRSENFLSKKEAKSLYKLILGMAIRGYRWDFADKRSEKPSKIADHCRLEDVSLDADTVRKWLRIALKEVKGISVSDE